MQDARNADTAAAEEREEAEEEISRLSTSKWPVMHDVLSQ